MSGGATREPVFVDSAARLAQAMASVAASPVVGFDTEFVGEHTYEPVLCLIQVAAGDAIYVIDPLVTLDLRSFWAALTEPPRELVAVAARQEVLFCLRHAGRAPAVLFDPQIAAGMVGFGYPLSHTNLVRAVLGARVEGGETVTDWRRRPLSAAQIAYAADDVRHLVAVREELLRRAWEIARVDWVRAECARAVERVVAGDAEERWWRVSGAAGLNRRQLAVLRELWRWREAAARSADVPSRRILSDDLLMLLTRRAPTTVPDLLAQRHLDRPALRRAAPEIVAAIRRGLDAPPADLPHTLKHDDPPQLGTLARLLGVLTNGLAAENRVDPALLATTADIEEFVRWHLSARRGQPPALLEGWRGDILGRAMEELLSGRMVIRVADARSPAPLRLDPWKRGGSPDSDGQRS